MFANMRELKMRVCVRYATVFGLGFVVMVASSSQQTTTPPRKLLDVMRVSALGDAAHALVIPKKGPVIEFKCDVVIVGAGLGGVSTALAASKRHTVCITEPTLWVGGQATSQGVSAFDDNKWINTTGGSSTYLALSDRIRSYYAKYRRNLSVSEEQSIRGAMSNPGGCWVGRLCFEPAPAEELLMSMLQPALRNGNLKLWTHTVPVEVNRNGRTITSVLAYDFGKSQWLRLRSDFFVEASELGELLPLSGLPYRVGAESRSETHERNAPEQANPRASQSFTYPFILEKHPRAGKADDMKPPAYESFLQHYTLTVDYGKGKLLTYGFFEAEPQLPGSFWNYRRSVDASLFQVKYFPADRSMINWSSNDHCDANLLSTDPLLQAQAMQNAKRASLGFAWWIRHKVPRDDKGGEGYPELVVMPNAMGSDDGLSQHPYIRESRRIMPLRTIVEEDLAVDFQHGARAAHYPDTVGIGWYPIDIHSCDHQDFTSQSKPYEIPLGALIDRDVENLMAVGKAMGTTHITNGAYRLHPTEWAAGEAVGVALEWSLDHGTTPAKLDGDTVQMRQLQLELVRSGHPVFWYDDIPVGSVGFAPMQMGAVQEWWSVDSQTLHGEAEKQISGDEASKALRESKLLGRGPLSWEDLRSIGLEIGENHGALRRQQFAEWMILRMK